MDDIWRFDLLNFEWSKLNTKLPTAVFFHSAAVTLVIFSFIRYIKICLFVFLIFL